MIALFSWFFYAFLSELEAIGTESEMRRLQVEAGEIPRDARAVCGR